MKSEKFLVKVAVVGCGCWGKNLVRNFHELGVLSAISDIDNKQVSKLQADYSVPSLSFPKLLERKDLDAVVIATPAEEHANLSERALKAGKHVFVEKPMVLDIDQGYKLCQLAKSMKKILMVGHLLQYHPAFVKLKEIVKEGVLGNLRYISSTRLDLGRIRRAENILWSFAPHDISMILAIVGEEPITVSATGANYLKKDIADVTTTHLVFNKGVKAHIFVSWLHPFKEQKLVLIAEEGMLVFNDGLPLDEKLQLYPEYTRRENGYLELVKQKSINISISSEEPLKRECQHFIECILNNSIPRTDGLEGLSVLRVLQAAELSMSKGGKVMNLLQQNFDKSDVIIHESAYVDQPCHIGKGTKIWHFSHILAGVRIGENCVIGQNVFIGPDVIIGSRCKIQNNVSLYKGVILEDGVFCGPSCVFTNVNTPRAEIDRKDEFLSTIVRRGATIGANATIVCGREIGAYSLVAAGAVVTRDVPSHALMAGIPAKQIGWVSHTGERLGNDLICPRTKRRYIVSAMGQLKLLESVTSNPV